MRCPFCKTETDSAQELTRHVERAHPPKTCPVHGRRPGDSPAPGVVCNGESEACPPPLLPHLGLHKL